MKRKLTLTIFFSLCLISTFSQVPTKGTIVQIDLNFLQNTIQENNIGNSDFQLSLPLPDGTSEVFTAQQSNIIENQPSDISTIKAVNNRLGITYRISITPTGLTGIMKFGNAYYLVEPTDAKEGKYIIYNLNDSGQGECGTNSPSKENVVNDQGQVLSAGLFPVGSQLRKYRFAGAATGEMTSAYGGQVAARDRIVAIMNATNLIYELEAAIRFELISKTTNLSLIFTNAGTDPFNVNTNFGQAGDSQDGFDLMNGNSTLGYGEYDTGHTFNHYATSGGARGTGGGSPCVNSSKAIGWTEFGTTSSLGLIVGVFVHEVGHQFNAWHTYNATGGSNGSPTFCTGGWDGQTAVEPGSGTTLMGYGGNCSNDTNGALPSYVLSEPNNENYFHTKSLDQIFTKMAGVSNCFTSVTTGNSPPVASVGPTVTIPKGTPFTLTGSATDANGDNLTYVWNQMDVATANDQGALGTSINGVGGYSAVNSTSAPLFRSRISSSPSRTFPDLNFILNNANNPGDNEGEDLPQVARTMNFRFTVRDNKSNGGGVDSEALIVTVANSGPLVISSYNTATTLAAGATVALNWAVNGTNALSANVKISLSIDGGNTFPFILAASTPNDGSHSFQIPANVPASSDARIKVSNIGSSGYEWFDLNNGKLTITSACVAVSSQICPINTLSGGSGNGIFNLGLSNFTGTELLSKTYSTNFAGASNRNILMYDEAGTACQQQGSGSSVVLSFQVTESGTYSLNSSDFVGMSILNSANVLCGNFVSSSITDGSYSSGFSANLNVCTNYYLILYNVFTLANVNVTFSGLGNVIQLGTFPGGSGYTYAAINSSTGNIAAVSSSSNFTSLSGGNYIVKGLNYTTGINPTTFVGFSEAAAYGTGSCIAFSSNSKILNITSSPCPSSVTLVSTANNITSGNITYHSSNTVNPGSIAATNKITGGTVLYDGGKKVELNPGFLAEGAVFTAKIGGCN